MARLVPRNLDPNKLGLEQPGTVENPHEVLGLDAFAGSQEAPRQVFRRISLVPVFPNLSQHAFENGYTIIGFETLGGSLVPPENIFVHRDLELQEAYLLLEDGGLLLLEDGGRLALEVP